MAVISGTNMRLSIGGNPLFHETNAKFSFSKNFEEVASKDIAGKDVIPGSYDWSLSAESLIAMGDGSTQEDVKTLLEAAAAGDLIAVEFTTGVSGDILLSGNVHVESCDVDAAHESGVTGSFSFKGVGDLGIALVTP